MILLAAASRLAPHPPNFNPVAALALFGGVQFADRRLAFAVPLAVMFLSDLIIGLHALIPVVYGSFLLIVGLGIWLRHHRNVRWITGATVISAVLFYVTTNFGVWVLDDLYPKTFTGLAECYVAALPFLRNAVFGNLFFSALLFGGLALAETRFAQLREGNVTA